MDKVIVHIETELNPTESEQKVKKAIENMFGSLETRIQHLVRGSLLTADTDRSEALTKLHNLLRRERIRDAARKVLFQGLDDKSVRFFLNKQVAYAGHVSFCQETGESPLGPIKVKIESRDPREIINWLTSKE